MSHVLGIVVRLRTDPCVYVGTDDHIYIGIVGTGGGREFPVDVKTFKGFGPDQDFKYSFGDVWDKEELVGSKEANEAHEWNDPQICRIEMDLVNTVYLRKVGAQKSPGQYTCRMDEVEVILYGDVKPIKRTFKRTTSIRLSNEYGLQVWLPETS